MVSLFYCLVSLLSYYFFEEAVNNFYFHVQEITIMGSIEHSIHVFNWMKNQKNYSARNDIYNMMIRLHARHNRIDQARGLFFEMQKWRYACFFHVHCIIINAFVFF